MGKLLDKIFGTHSEQEIKKIMPMVDTIDALSETMKGKTDAELKAYTDVFKKRLNQGETLDDILIEAFAVCREAATRCFITHIKFSLLEESCCIRDV